MLSLCVALSVLWLSLSGRAELLLLGLGVLSISLVLWLTLRMEMIDPEEHPYRLRVFALAPYWGWLLWQIVKSSLDVSRRILSPQLPIRPRLLSLPCKLEDDLRRMIYANSITLTPGTVTVQIDSDHVEVHALSGESEVLESGEMERRVAVLEERRT